MLTTPNLALKKPEANDTVNIADLNYNADVLDQEVVKRIVNSGGVPSIQAGLDAEKPAPGTAGRLYVATDTQIIYRDTGSAWQKVGVVKWDDIEGKPSSFTPSAHKTTHATGGADALAPADIGAASAADLAAHLADYAPHGATSANTANRIVLRDALGNFSAGTITATLNGNADKVDNIHFRVYNGALQYSVDGSVWNDMILKAKAWKTVDVVLPNFNTNWQTVCDVTGKGVLTRISVYGSLGSRPTIEYLDVKVTVDGVEYTFDVSNNPFSRSLRQYNSSGYMNAVDFIHLITFDNSLKVEVRTTYGEIGVNASVDFALV